DCQWHDRYRAAREDAFDTGPEGRDLAVGGEAAFREDADDVTFGEGTVDLVEGLFQEAWILLCRGDRNGLGGAEDEAQDRRPENLVVHDEARRTPHAAGDDQRIHVTDMVADKQGRAVLGYVVEPLG